jgi:hypothetical protein
MSDLPPEAGDGLSAEEEHHPRGTFLLLMLFLLLIVIYWGWTYVILLERGV